MGVCWRRNSSKYYAKGITFNIPISAPITFGSPSTSSHKSEASRGPFGIYPRLVAKRCSPGDYGAHPSVFLPNVYRGKEKREIASNSGSLEPEQNDCYPTVQNGELGENRQTDLSMHVGNIGRYNQRVLACSNLSGIPDIFCFSSRGSDLCVSGSSIRVDNSSLGVLQGDEAHKGLPSSSRSDSIIILGRLSYSCLFEVFSQYPHQMDSGSSDVVGLRSEFREVLVNSPGEAGILGYHVGSSVSVSFSSRRKNCQNSEVLSRGALSFVDFQKGARVPDRLSKLCHKSSSIGKTLFEPSHHVDEFKHNITKQGFASSCGYLFQGGFNSLAKQGIPRTVSSYEHSGSFFRYHDGRLRPWLVWCSPAPAGAGEVVRGGTLSSNRLERIEGDSLCSLLFQGGDPGKLGSSSFRQHYSSVVPPSSGVYSLSRSIPSFQGYFRIMPFSQYWFDPCPHQRGSECSCRPRFERRSHCYRVVFGSSLFFFNLSAVKIYSRGGPFRHPFQFPVAFVRISIPRQLGSCLGRNVAGLEPIWISIRISPSWSPSTIGKETSEFPRLRFCHRPLLANGSLVSSLISKMQAEVPSSSGISPVPTHIRRPGSDGRGVEPLGLDPVIKSRVVLGTKRSFSFCKLGKAS